MENITFIDLQGFKHKNNDFVLKEICIIQNNSILHASVKSPYEWRYLPKDDKKQATWLKHNYHGINWSDGLIDISDITKIIKKLFENLHGEIYVKGKEKICWIKKIFNFNDKITNIEDLGCHISFNNSTKKLKENITQCKFHNQMQSINCAYRNCICLKNWYKINNQIESE